MARVRSGDRDTSRPEVITSLRVGRKPKYNENDIESIETAINELLEECAEQGVHPTDSLLQAKLGIRADKFITRYRTGTAPKQIVPEIQELFEQYKTIARADLEDGGLNFVYNAKMAEFLLQNNHGMAQKQEQITTGASTLVFVNDLGGDETESTYEKYIREQGIQE